MIPQERRPPITPLRVLLWLGAIAAVLVSVDLAQRFSLYEIRERDRRSVPRMVRRPIKDTALTLLHGLPRSFEREQDLSVFDFYLKPKDEALLRANMTEVQTVGTHTDRTRQWIDARMDVDGERYDVRIKLRGRQHYHVVPPRPSLRVKIRRGRTYRGQRVFNLVEPFDKTGDQVFLWEAEEHGLIGWDTAMGVVALNGRPVQLVHQVEQIRRATSDRTGRPEGMFFRGTGEHYTEGGDPERCGAAVARITGWLADTDTVVGYDEMHELLDLERFHWFTALTELSGDGHGFYDINMKGYCNPVSIRSEFVVWDTRFGIWRDLPRSDYPEMGGQFLRNDRFRLLHDRALHTLATERVDPMLARYAEFDAAWGELQARDPFSWFPRGGPDGGLMVDRSEKLDRTLRRNAADIRAALEGLDLEWRADPAARTLLLRTADRGAKHVTALRVRTPDGPALHALPEPATVAGRYWEHQPVVALPLPAALEAGDVLGVVAENVHTGRAVAARASAEPLVATTLARLGDEAPAPLPPLPEGFRIDAAARQIAIGPGPVRLEGALLLPAGWNVTVAPGTVLEAGPDALLEMRGDLAMRGSAEQPIRVRGNGAGEWGALAVLGERTAPVRVEIAHTEISGGRGSNAGSARYTGSLAIYYADVVLDHLSMTHGQADDAINLKYATFVSRDGFYRDGAGDAVDYDFSQGLDLRTRVLRFPDDGIDISGARIRIEGAVIQDVGDKALSIGEGSTPEIADVRVSGANVGCAVKDRSDARIERLTVARSNTAVSLYTKKPSFGSPRATFRGLVAIDVGALAIVDAGSQLEFVDATRIGASGSRMRAFAGVENVVDPAIPQLDPDELFRLAERRRPAPGPTLSAVY